MLLRHSTFSLLWTAIVSLLCGLRGNSFPDLSLWALLRFDSFAHAFVFAVFSFLWAVAFCKHNRYRFLKQNGITAALLFGIVYGVLIEIMQYAIFFRRSAEWTDMLSDSIGSVIGVIVFYFIYKPVLGTSYKK